MKISLVIPARNEEDQIGATVTGLRDHLVASGIDSFEILVVDDGSSDDTAALVEQLGTEDERIVLHHNDGDHGYGRAVRAGLEHFTGDAVIVYMADASDSPADVVTYYQILKDEAECAFGSRWTSDSEVIDYPLFKLVINRLANAVIRIMFGLRYNDVTNAFKGYRRCVVDGCRPFISPHFNLTIEMPLKAITRGYTYQTVPIKWVNRTSGISRLVLKEQGSRYLFVLLSVWFEWLLVRRDYHRPASEQFQPWSDEVPHPTEETHT
jgi:dolichol-phosphate mannosyltransferase